MQEHIDINSSVPFLLLNEKKKMMLLPVIFLHKEASMLVGLNPLTEVPSVVTQFDIPLKKWVHVGCEVCNMSVFVAFTLYSTVDLILCYLLYDIQASQNSLRLRVNGEIVGEKHLSPVLNDELHADGMKRRALPCIIGEYQGFQGYVHFAKLSPSGLPLKTHCIEVQITYSIKSKFCP